MRSKPHQSRQYPSTLPNLQIPASVASVASRSTNTTRGTNTPADTLSLAGTAAGSESVRRQRVQFWSKWRKRLAKITLRKDQVKEIISPSEIRKGTFARAPVLPILQKPMPAPIAAPVEIPRPPPAAPPVPDVWPNAIELPGAATPDFIAEMGPFPAWELDGTTIRVHDSNFFQTEDSFAIPDLPEMGASLTPIRENALEPSDQPPQELDSSMVASPPTPLTTIRLPRRARVETRLQTIPSSPNATSPLRDGPSLRVVKSKESSYTIPEEEDQVEVQSLPSSHDESEQGSTRAKEKARASWTQEPIAGEKITILGAEEKIVIPGAEEKSMIPIAEEKITVLPAEDMTLLPEEGENIMVDFMVEYSRSIHSASSSTQLPDTPMQPSDNEHVEARKRWKDKLQKRHPVEMAVQASQEPSEVNLRIHIPTSRYHPALRSQRSQPILELSPQEVSPPRRGQAVRRRRSCYDSPEHLTTDTMKEVVILAPAHGIDTMKEVAIHRPGSMIDTMKEVALLPEPMISSMKEVTLFEPAQTIDTMKEVAPVPPTAQATLPQSKPPRTPSNNNNSPTKQPLPAVGKRKTTTKRHIATAETSLSEKETAEARSRAMAVGLNKQFGLEIIPVSSRPSRPQRPSEDKTPPPRRMMGLVEEKTRRREWEPAAAGGGAGVGGLEMEETGTRVVRRDLRRDLEVYQAVRRRA